MRCMNWQGACSAVGEGVRQNGSGDMFWSAWSEVGKLIFCGVSSAIF